MKSLAVSAALLGATLALGAIAAPSSASQYAHHPVSKRQYASVYQWDEVGHVELTWGLEGHRTNRFTTDVGTFKTKTYPTHIAGDTARAVFILYPLDLPGQHTWALYKTKWCVPAPTVDDPTAMSCSPTPPTSTPAPPA